MDRHPRCSISPPDQAAIALLNGKIDAMFVVAAPETGLVRTLLYALSIKLLSFSRAVAYSRTFPHLSIVMLPHGTIDLVRDIAAGLDVSVSVNITVGFIEELAVTENIIALAQNVKVSANRIILEITESTETTHVVTVIGNLARLRMRGFGLSIDDFGTGYASMQQLSRIPFNELKVDRSFVSGAARYPNLRTILESSLELGRRLGL